MVASMKYIDHDTEGRGDRGWNLERISFVDRIQTASIAEDFHPIFRKAQRLSRVVLRLSIHSTAGIKLSAFIMSGPGTWLDGSGAMKFCYAFYFFLFGI